MKLYPYMAGSAGAKALAAALGIKRLRRTAPEINIKGATVINWGCSNIGRVLKNAAIINKPAAVKKATNKLEAFKAMQGTTSVPSWTESREEALQWLVDGCIVVVRHKLSGHSGEGIEIVEKGAELPDAPLYTKYIPKKNEYRIHVNNGVAFFVQKKVRNKGIEDEKINWQVRNHVNGFVFSHVNVAAPECAQQEAIKAVAALGLDFGAVDIIQHAVKGGGWYVLEVNTACGLSGKTVDKYVEQFRGMK
jgi:glutathione synthase/RimK-type ligase-like ATP-grasp enzyme